MDNMLLDSHDNLEGNKINLNNVVKRGNKLKRKSKISEKSNALSSKRLSSFIKLKAIGSEKIRLEYLKELQSSNNNYDISECCFIEKYIDKGSVLIGINSNTCKKCSLPIYVKCADKIGWNHNNCYYCRHDCMIEGK